ncbi:histidine phosphatase family protein [Paracoccus zeaxanthinifaciens]|uniref:histidine phosphatase family protein n=1 Tax=Paracoccus zeaxanthinifaciens TaxID=187400 RepID=UPI0004116089|nr:histidine phosphatase family protein [Paracoccus zeaxanthinifaciens]
MRHGETAWNVQDRLQGILDSPLTDRGIEQARRLAELSNGIAGRRISSPQGRAVATARIAFGQDFATDPRLSEIDVGDFTGRLLSDLRGEHPGIFIDDFGWYDRCPGGEGFARLATRCRSLLDDLDGPALIVTHGVTLRMLRCLILGLPIDRIGQGEARQGAIHAFRQGHESLIAD